VDKQIVEISSDNIQLSLSRGFLEIRNNETGIKNEVPMDNILSLVLSSNNIMLSKNIINAVCEQGGNIVLCGKNYSPTSIVMPYVGHWLAAPRIREQIDSSLPLRKNLWRNIIQNKISNQALILEYFFPQNENIEKLKRLSRKTLSNDTRNNEGQAAKIYFKSLFGKNFIRDRDSDNINILLNYTYMVLRAMVARAVTGNGLLPYLGIKHCTRANPMPLVDDLIEPFRSIADKIVFEEISKLIHIDKINLIPEIKRNLTKIVSYPVNTYKGCVSLCDALYEFTDSLVESYENKKIMLKYPSIAISNNF
jgi:CRISPR-associated protein Cas1